MLINSKFTDCHLGKQSTEKHEYSGKHVYIMCNKINKSKLKTTFKPMIAFDKKRNFYTCGCM